MRGPLVKCEDRTSLRSLQMEFGLKQIPRLAASSHPSSFHRLRPIVGRNSTSCQASKQRSYAGRHRHSTKQVKYEAVKRNDTSEFEIGSEVVPLDTPVIIPLQQRGFFPLLQKLIPIEEVLEVVITRDLDVAENWVRRIQQEKKVELIGYCVHERPVDLKQGSRIAYIPQGDEIPTMPLSTQSLDIDDQQLKMQTSDGLIEAEEKDLSLRLDDFKEIRTESQNDELSYELDDLLIEDHEDDYIDEDDENQPIVYKVGNVEIIDYHPPKVSRSSLPPPFPPQVFTRDPNLALSWILDRDGTDGKQLTIYARRIAKNIISILTLCHRNQVLILQLRRMAGIGPELTNLLFSQQIKKAGFEQEEVTNVLDAINVKIQNEVDLEELLIQAMERESFEEIPKPFRKLARPQLMRVLTGIDISDIVVYQDTWNNPFLSEKELVCAAKEAYSVYSMARTLSRANYRHFFNIDIFVLNPIPPSFLDLANRLPPTTYHHLTIQRGPFYEDLGKLLEGMDFKVKITMTREVSIAEHWAQRQLTEKQVKHVGVHHEWVQGRYNQVTALFVISTKDEVLICQHLYLTTIPHHLKKLLEWKEIRKTGRSMPHVKVFKKDQGRIGLRGYTQIGSLLLKLGGKKKKRNLPKVIRDLKFGDLTKLLIGVDHQARHLSSSVRWDKPNLTIEEIEYQAMEAWLSWALIHIFLKTNETHGEKLKAFLLGSTFVPKIRRLPSKVRKSFLKELSLEKKKELKTMELESSNKQDIEDIPSELEVLSSKSTQRITHQELNHLFDTLFEQQSNTS